MPRTNPDAPLCTGPVLRLSVGITTEAQQFEVVLDHMGAAFIGINTASLITFLTGWRANAEASWKAVLAPDCQINVYTVAEVQTGACPTLVAPQTGIVGLNGTDSYPGFAAAIGTKYTSLKGQHGRGRCMFGPVALADLTPATSANKLIAAAITRYNTLCTALQMPVVVAGVNFSLAVSTRPKIPATLVSKAIPVSSMVMQAVLGTVRRRRFGRGQ